MAIKHKLRDDWRDGWRFISMRAIGLGAGVQATWATLPDDWKASVPHDVITWVTMCCLALGAYGVMVKQEALSKDEQP